MRLRELSFSYRESPIFSNASVEFRAPIDMVVGPSGSGKTTLLRVLAGVLQAQASMLDPSASSRLLLLQEDALIPWLTGWDNLMTFLRPHGVREADIRLHPGFAAIESFVDRHAWRMSFGQRRSIELLRALVRRPQLLCLDEPLNFLDPDLKVLFADLILKHDGIDQIVIASHEMSEFAPLAAEALYLDGRFPVGKICRRSGS